MNNNNTRLCDELQKLLREETVTIFICPLSRTRNTENISTMHRKTGQMLSGHRTDPETCTTVRRSKHGTQNLKAEYASKFDFKPDSVVDLPFRARFAKVLCATNMKISLSFACFRVIWLVDVLASRIKWLFLLNNQNSQQHFTFSPCLQT